MGGGPVNGYTRWTRHPYRMSADILGSRVAVEVDLTSGVVELFVAKTAAELSPDEARMIGVRLIEAAVHADADTVIREKSGG